MPLVIDGANYHVIAYEYADDIVLTLHPDDEWTIATQRTSFHEEGRPTMEIVLIRPLHGATMIPLGTPYAWDLNPMGDERTGTCVIEMVHDMAMRRTQHVYKHCFDDWQACKTACLRVRKDIYPDAREYPFGRVHEDDYSGYTAEVVIKLAEQHQWAIYILHGANKVYSGRPDSDSDKKIQNLPIICFSIHDDHAFYYERSAAAAGGAIQSIANMKMLDSIPCPMTRNIDICGDERENIKVFGEWKQRSLLELYNRVEVPTKAARKDDDVDHATGCRRQRTSEYYFTHDIYSCLDCLQHTRADKVRGCQEEAKDIVEQDGYHSLDDVLQRFPALAEPEDYHDECSPVRFEVRSTRSPQDPERIKHLFVTFKKVSIRITQVPNDVEQLFGMCRAAGVEYRCEGAQPSHRALTFVRSRSLDETSRVSRQNWVRERPKDLCECGEELGDSLELDHIQPLAQGVATASTMSSSSVVIATSQRQGWSAWGGMPRHNPLASVMSRDLLEQFTMSPTPPQLLVGKVKAGNLGLYVIACRTSAIYNNQFGVTSFQLAG